MSPADPSSRLPDPARPRTEAEYLAQYDPSAFERPSVTTDVVVITHLDGALHTLLVQRDEFPHKGRWMLPGGFVGIDEGLDAAAARTLDRKTGLRGEFLEQLYTFGSPDRDPRMRIISVAYLALVPAHRLAAAMAQRCRIDVAWPGEAGGPATATLAGEPLALAFDHADVLGLAVKRLRGRLNYTPIAYALLPEEFTLRALQEVHEAILGHALNKPAFRRRLLASGELIPTGRRETHAAHRPAELFRCALDL